MNELKPRSAEQATCSANAELTEADVRKALECCTKGPCWCKECPIGEGEGCVTRLAEAALALLQKYRAKISGLEAEVKKYKAPYTLAVFHGRRSGKTNALVERLRNDPSEHITVKNFYEHEIRAEASSEFAERLKASLNDVARWQMHGVEGEYFIIGKSLIDKIAKEMEEQNGG